MMRILRANKTDAKTKWIFSLKIGEFKMIRTFAKQALHFDHLTMRFFVYDHCSLLTLFPVLFATFPTASTEEQNPLQTNLSEQTMTTFADDPYRPGSSSAPPNSHDFTLTKADDNGNSTVSPHSRSESMCNDYQFDDNMDTMFENTTGCKSATDLDFVSSSSEEDEEIIEKRFMFNVTAFNCDEERCQGYCHCDEDCFYFQDCCYNVLEKKLNDPVNENISISDILRKAKNEILTDNSIYEFMACVFDAEKVSGVWMVYKCPVIGDFDADERFQCESDINEYSYQSVPIDQIDQHTYIQTFKNVHCARCHGVELSQLRYWNANIHCSNANKTIITEATPIEDILRFCTITFYSHYGQQMRKCPGIINEFINVKNVTDDSPSDLDVLCQSNIMPVKTFGTETDTLLFRNPHCASIHGFDGLTCKTEPPDYGHLLPGNSVNLRVFFDINPTDGGVEQNVQCRNIGLVCGRFEIYDCGSLRCRFLYCPYGHVPLYGKCVVGDDFFLKRKMVATQPTDRSNISHRDVYYIFQLQTENNVTFKMSLRDAINMATSDMANSSMIGEIIELNSSDCTTPCVLVKVVDISLFVFSVSIFSYLQKAYVHDHIGKGDNTADHVHTASLTNNGIPFNLKVKNFETAELLECREEHTEVIKTRNVTFNIPNPTIDIIALNMTLRLNETKWEYSVSSVSGVTSGLVITCMLKDPSLVLNCSMVVYNLSEVDIGEDIATINYTGEVIMSGRFYIYGKNIFVCSEDVILSFKYVNIYRYLDTYRNLTYVTSALSIFATVSLLFFHIIDARLRNIHGLNLCAISIAILLTHSLMLAQPLFKETTACKAFGMFSYFLLINTFSWMNCIGIEMACTFGSRLIVSKTNVLKRFFRYVTISSIVSMAILSVSLVFEFIPVKTRVNPSYGRNGVCWMTNGQAVLAFVVFPVALAIVFNIVVYAVIFVSICRQRLAARFAAKTGSKSYFVVFLKLSIILGLTWLVGLVAAFVDQEWLWYIHIVLNGLQGLSLLVCSVVNRRVVRQMRSSLNLNSILTTSSGHVVSQRNKRNST